MAYPAWVPPQAMDTFGGFQGGFGIGQRLGSERAGREGFAKYSDWLGQQQGQFAREQPGFLANAAMPNAYAPTGEGIVAGSHSAAQGATVPGLQGGLESYIANARAAESGGDPNARNPRSSATGLYQFTSGTWNDLMRQHPNLGLTPEGRTDPAQQERAMRQFTLGNAQSLSSAGLPVTPGTLYASHFLGSGGARSVLSQNDNVPMANAVSPEVISANPFLRDMTVGQFRRWADQKGGGTNGGYAPPQTALDAANAMGGESAEQSPAMAFAAPGSPPAPAGTLPPPEIMQALFRSPETRPLAISLAQTAQAGMQPPEFTQFQREDGSVWQMNTQTGQMQVLQGGTGPGSSSFSQTPVFLTDPEGNTHIAQMSNTGGILVNGEQLAGVPEGWVVTNRPQGMSSVDLGGSRGVFNPNTGEYMDGPAIQGSPGQNMNVAIDPQSGQRVMEPAPGSDQALAREATAEAAEAARRNARDYARTVTQDIGVALNDLDNLGGISTWDNPAGGAWASTMSNIPRTTEFNMRQFVESALSNVTLDTMNRMREGSPAGATGFGNMSERQMAVIRGVLGQWNPGLPVDQQRYILHRLHNFYMDVVVGTREEREEALRDGRLTPEEFAEYETFYYPETRDVMGRPLGDGEIPAITVGPADRGSAPAPAAADGQTATNPQTGERLIYRNGQWEPM